MEDIAFLDAVRAQPAVLARSAATVRAALAPAVDRLRSGRLLVFGMGASTHAATAFAAMLRAAGRPALAASASEVGTPGLADAYPTREYLHGPVEAAGPGRGALVFHDPDLADRLAGYGTSVVHLPDTGVAGLGGCVLDMLPVQLLAYRLADRAGIPIGLRHM